MVLGLVLGGAGGAGAWFFAPPPKHLVWTSIHLPPAVHTVVRTSDPDPRPDEFQRTQVALGKSRLVLRRALQDPAVARLSLVNGQLDALAWLEKEVRIDFAVAPQVMRISMSGLETDELEVLVNAVRKAFLREVVDHEKIARQDQHAFVWGLIQQYEDQLKVARVAQRDLAEQVGGRTAMERAGLRAFAEQQLFMFERDLLRVKSERWQGNLKLNYLKQQSEKVKDLQLVQPGDLERALDTEPQTVLLRKKIEQLELDAAGYANRSARGEGHPVVVANRKTILGLKDEIRKLHDRLRPELQKLLKERAETDLKTRLAIQESQMALLQRMEEELGPEVERLRAKVFEIARKAIKLDGFQEDLSHLQEMTKRLKSEYEAQKVVLQIPSPVRTLEPATVTRADVQTRKLTMAGGVSVGGFLFALFGVAWLEFRLRRVYRAEEVAGLGIRLLGTVPKVAGRRPSAAKPAGRDDPSQQVLTESVSAAGTMLLHLARAHTVRSVMVTSPGAGEGKTSLTCRLAASLARGGLRTLVIDADIYNPNVHKVFGLVNGPGFGEALAGQGGEPAAQPTPVAGLSVLTAGAWGEQAQLALAQGRLGGLLERLGAQFDFILVDSSPVLPVANTLLVGQQVDGVLFSALCHTSRLHDLHEASRRVEDLDIRVLGVVVNGIQGAADKYKYPVKVKA